MHNEVELDARAVCRGELNLCAAIHELAGRMGRDVTELKVHMCTGELAVISELAVACLGNYNRARLTCVHPLVRV